MDGLKTMKAITTNNDPSKVGSMIAFRDADWQDRSK